MKKQVKIFKAIYNHSYVITTGGPSTVDQVPSIKTKYKYWSSTHFYKKVHQVLSDQVPGKIQVLIYIGAENVQPFGSFQPFLNAVDRFCESSRTDEFLFAEKV